MKVQTFKRQHNGVRPFITTPPPNPPSTSERSFADISQNSRIMVEGGFGGGETAVFNVQKTEKISAGFGLNFDPNRDPRIGGGFGGALWKKKLEFMTI